VPECSVSQNKSIKINDENYNMSFDMYLGNNFPEPFDGNTVIPCFIPDKSDAKLIINDMFGRKIAEYDVKQGANNIDVNLSNYSQGVYFYGLIINGIPINFKKMVLTNKY
jgi:hypothetical protein